MPGTLSRSAVVAGVDCPESFPVSLADPGGPVAVPLPALPAGKTVCVRFTVAVNDDVQHLSQITHTAQVSSVQEAINLSRQVSTLVNLPPPFVQALISADPGATGSVVPGDRIAYSVRVSSQTINSQDVSSTNVVAYVPLGTTFAPGSLTVSSPPGAQCPAPSPRTDAGPDGDGARFDPDPPATFEDPDPPPAAIFDVANLKGVQAFCVGYEVIVGPAPPNPIRTDAIFTPSELLGARTNKTSTPVAPRTLSINDVSVTEGNAGPTIAAFTASLSYAPIETTTVQVATADDTASRPGDYTQFSQGVIFQPGDTSEPVEVAVNGDTIDEPNEQFFVDLSTPAGAAIGDGRGVGTITDDDATPVVVIEDPLPMVPGPDPDPTRRQTPTRLPTPRLPPPTRPTSARSPIRRSVARRRTTGSRAPTATT